MWKESLLVWHYSFSPKEYLLQLCLTKTFIPSMSDWHKDNGALLCIGTNCIQSHSGPDYEVHDSPWNHNRKVPMLRISCLGLLRGIYINVTNALKKKNLCKIIAQLRNSIHENILRVITTIRLAQGGDGVTVPKDHPFCIRCSSVVFLLKFPLFFFFFLLVAQLDNITIES